MPIQSTGQRNFQFESSRVNGNWKPFQGDGIPGFMEKKKNLHLQVAKAAGFVSIILGYAYVEASENLEHRFGLIVTVFMFALLSAPLLGIKEIVKKEDASSLPFPMILSGTVVTFLWFLYGFIIQNLFIQFQNIAAFTLCSTQLTLCILFPGSKTKKKKDVKKQ
uniref:Sugar transporter SWEET1 n=1 Tax=Cacopsylla melanoneura TaxID=428564 RepID=A0A8D9FC46_9HEMI